MLTAFIPSKKGKINKINIKINVQPHFDCSHAIEQFLDLPCLTLQSFFYLPLLSCNNTVGEKTDGGRKLHLGSSVHTPVVFRLIRAKSPNNLPGEDD